MRAQVLRETARPGHGVDGRAQALIEQCLECANVASATGFACLDGATPELSRCARACIDASDLCRLVAALMSRGPALDGALCRACAEVCEGCAGECERNAPRFERFAACAAALRACARACRQMLGS